MLWENNEKKRIERAVEIENKLENKE